MKVEETARVLDARVLYKGLMTMMMMFEFVVCMCFNQEADWATGSISMDDMMNMPLWGERELEGKRQTEIETESERDGSCGKKRDRKKKKMTYKQTKRGIRKQSLRDTV